MPLTSRSPLLLAGFLAAAGVAHFAAPASFDAMVPRALPGNPRSWTRVSGAVELALAAGIAAPRTRQLSAQATALFFVGVFPANLKMAYDWRTRPAPARALAYGRLPLQLPLYLWARAAARPTTG
ncbi:DoxX family protein [Streptomyces sp. NBC_01201]|uniref:DoxX family protein n=1 Tax=Streptomyces glycanivorans TaxID=3033808 RepID=A0ABY9JPS5_9ACTN|nr:MULTISPECIES: DoxX family protein [unclassified Streptomyces]WSQ82531.1 DoxX family protein [Streptomyces sp. NBC_01213]WLQ69145.1 DoxX family protein [Streptomyces sp. Alt3]WSQ89850.1 DoxX family protein [Streptomyces sp. NBC_01212]WSR11171.1 DoxX family protein [Streptomyces sp. NBC_01208]WSR53200.1 DoxX family protein [Streptomyces sp. NBC_01201]